MLLLMLVLIMSVSTVCQSQDVFEKVSDNPDGSKRIKINGATYLAITGPQIDAWQKAINEFDGVQLHLKEKETQIRELTLERDLAESQKALIQEKADGYKRDAERERENGKRNFGLLLGQQELTRQAVSQFIPHGSAGGFGGKLLAAIDSPYTQGFFKLFIPTAQTIRAFTIKPCTQ